MAKSSELHPSSSTGPAALENFKYKAVIDWIWLRITLSSPSQFRHVQERMKSTFGKLHVEACDDDSNSSSLKFAFKVQDPRSPDHLMHELQSAVRPGDPCLTEDKVEILGVELALDAYHRGKDCNALAPAVQYLFVHHALLVFARASSKYLVCQRGRWRCAGRTVARYEEMRSSKHFAIGGNKPD